MTLNPRNNKYDPAAIHLRYNRHMFLRGVVRNLIKICAFSIVIGGFVVLGFYLSVAPIGNEIFLSPIPLAVVALLLAVVIATPAGLILLIWPKYREIGLTMVLGSIILVIVTFYAVRFGSEIRMKAFENLARRSRPLVSAIKQFESNYGRPPERLEQLVPEFMEQIPGTGIGAYPNYEYKVITDKRYYEGNSWVLVVSTPSGVLNWDTFMYLPNQNYPQSGYGGVLERIDDWAYVHE